MDYRTFQVQVTASLFDCGNRLRRRKMLEMLPEIQDRIILEVGLGSGDFYLALNERFGPVFNQYLGMDLSGPNLENARVLGRKYEALVPKVHFLQADLFESPIRDQSADVVICAEVLEHLDDERAMEHMERWLKPGGTLLLTVPYLGEPVAGWGHLRHYDMNRIHDLAKRTGLLIEKTHVLGRLHERTWVVFKHALFRIWAIWKKLTGETRDYYESVLHRVFVMPVVDALLRWDDCFSGERSCLGDKGYLIALLRKPL